MILLEVPFSEKDQAKALGARWNAVEKKWYVPDELHDQLADFAKWHNPSQTQQINESPLSVGAVPANEAEKGISLSQLMGQVQSVLRSGFAGAVWVKAEIANIQERRGHYYLELSESAESGQSIASCRAMIWQGAASRLLSAFEQTTGTPLCAGQKILLLGEVSFHEKFGFSLNIQDIDARFTLGEIEANLNKIRLQLQSEGVYSNNKRFKMPQDFFSVAVIAPPNAAGLGDFKADADLLHKAKLCRFQYFYAAFQGDSTEREIAIAHQAILALHKSQTFDAIIIIRGGGAKLDLNNLNAYTLARLVTDSPIPVLTGIGHERDNTILDEVAAVRFDTPSKVIAAIRQNIFGHAQQAKQHWLQIEQASRQYIQQQYLHLQKLDHAILQKSQQICHLWQQRVYPIKQQVLQQSRTVMQDWHHKILPLGHEIEQQSQQRLQREKSKLVQLFQIIEQESKQKITLQALGLRQLKETVDRLPLQIVQHSHKQIKQWMGFIISSGPQSQLSRGFALIKTPEGKPLKSAAQTQIHSRVHIEFADGTLQATVDAKKTDQQL